MSIEGVYKTDNQILLLAKKFCPIVEQFIEVFPGTEGLEIHESWLNDWFLSRVNVHYSNDLLPLPDEGKIDTWKRLLKIEEEIKKNKPTQFVSIQPNFFRGFKKIQYPINFEAKLLVIYGKNSSGKTSLAEAFEWCITGKLSRRDMNKNGDASELTNFIQNQFLPEDETVWVKISIQIEDKIIELKRELLEDYDNRLKSEPKSIFFIDDVEQSKAQEKIFFEKNFNNTPPILMQHSLKSFILSNPTERRNYFEKLLKLDEITLLIHKAVIGASDLNEIKSKNENIGLESWNNLMINLETADKNLFNRRIKSNPETNLIIKDLSIKLFPDERFEEYSIEEINEKLQQLQTEKKKQLFPFISKIKSKIISEADSKKIINKDILSSKLEEYLVSQNSLDKAQKAAKDIEKSQLAIVRALKELEKENLINLEKEIQQCPLCLSENKTSLTKERIGIIHSWTPIQDALDNATTTIVLKHKNFLSHIKALQTSCLELIPRLSDEDIASIRLNSKGKEFSDIVNEIIEDIKETNKNHHKIDTIINLFIENNIVISELKKTFDDFFDEVNKINTSHKKYTKLVTTLEEFIVSLSKEDPIFSQRENWLSVFKNKTMLYDDLKWDKSKDKANKELKSIRNILKEIRKEYLNFQRDAFNEEISAIWNALRNDRYSSFSNISIPEPKGKGYPVKIEVKALIDDGEQKKKVDVLSVFSESQINVLGIAAFITRSKLLGHKTIMLDDPVQSMDEEHFTTFASQLLPELLENNNQVILFTHNYNFATKISYQYSGDNNYITLNVKHSKRKGCYVEEGNRKISEKLKRAIKDCDVGNFDAAWINIRKAIERMDRLH